MAKVTFFPLGKTVEAQSGETLLDIAMSHDIPMAHACGGFCACTTCHVLVKQGAENLSEMEDDETERLDRATAVTLHSRLGCQAKIKGSGDVQVTVEIMNPESGH